jgi:3-oxoacyl-[acyl-carrier protein] reductase
MIHEISERRREELLARIPMGRWCQATEVAAMVAWIAGEECSFSTGAVFDISGGRSTW